MVLLLLLPLRVKNRPPHHPSFKSLTPKRRKNTDELEELEMREFGNQALHKIGQIFSNKRTRIISFVIVGLLIFWNFFFVWVFPLVTLINGPLFPPSGF